MSRVICHCPISQLTDEARKSRLPKGLSYWISRLEHSSSRYEFVFDEDAGTFWGPCNGDNKRIPRGRGRGEWYLFDSACVDPSLACFPLCIYRYARINLKNKQTSILVLSWLSCNLMPMLMIPIECCSRHQFCPFPRCVLNWNFGTQPERRGVSVPLFFFFYDFNVL